MKHTWLAVVLGVLFVAGCAAPAEKLVFKNYGFAISPLDDRERDDEDKVLELYLPASGLGWPRVIVGVEKYSSSIADYLALARGGHMAYGETVLSEVVQGDTLLMEYLGKDGGSHSYRRVVFKSGRVIFAMADVSASQWREIRDKIKACVDSLEVPPVAEPGQKLVFRKLGFAIAPVDVPLASGVRLVLSMYLSHRNECPGVGVSTEPFAGTIADYLARFKNEVDSYPGSFRYRILSSVTTEQTLFIETESSKWEGDSRIYPCYDRIVLKNGIAYKAHAEAEQGHPEGWKEVSARVKACLNSLEVIPVEKSERHGSDKN